jgi:hypothetical protein
MENKNSFFSNYSFEIISIDYSGYIVFIGFIILFVFLVWFLLNKKRKPKVLTQKQILLEKINRLEFTNNEHKKLAYDFTILIKSYIDEENKEFEQILKELEVYKYHNNDIKINSHLLDKMKRFIDELE